jgi:hypothetical protein
MADIQATAQDRTELELLLRGFMVSRMLRLVADLSLADRIPPDGEFPVRDLAVACGVLEGPLLRILRSLASLGVFRVSTEGMVRHSPKSALLRTDAPDSAHYAARFWAGPGSWAAWGQLDAALTGGIPHEAAWDGQGRFAYLQEHPEEARAFDEMMAHFPDNRHAAVAEAYDVSAARLVADIGGGNGAMLRHLLARAPAARGLLFDRPDVVAALGPEALLDGRIETAGGSFLDAVPAGADHVVLSRVLHDWPDEGCTRILANCRAAMAPGAVLLVVEALLEPDPARGRPTDYLIDMQMMAMFGTGRQRSEAEFHALLAAAGFAWRRTIPTASPVSALEAVAI